MGILTSFLNHRTMWALSLDGADRGHGSDTLRPSTANFSVALTASIERTGGIQFEKSLSAVVKVKWTIVMRSEHNSRLIEHIKHAQSRQAMRSFLSFRMKLQVSPGNVENWKAFYFFCRSHSRESLTKKGETKEVNFQLWNFMCIRLPSPPASCNCNKNVIKSFYWIL